MPRRIVKPRKPVPAKPHGGYDAMLTGVVELLETARRTSARAVNAVMTATYWEIGRRIVEYEQGGASRAEYGEALVVTLARDLTARFGRGFTKSNLYQMRAFYLAYPQSNLQTAPGISPESIFQTPSGKSAPSESVVQFPLPWSHYVRLLSVKNDHARRFYEAETIRGGWSIRQLNRQISTQFYERTALSKNKALMLTQHAKTLPEDAVKPRGADQGPIGLGIPGTQRRILRK